MAVKVKMTVMMAVVVMMVVTSVVTVDAKLDFSQILASSLGIQTNTYVTPETEEGSACCDMCPCTRSIPPQCHCADVKTSCYKGCKRCMCRRSNPPQCQCTDIQNFCYKPCTTTTTTMN